MRYRTYAGISGTLLLLIAFASVVLLRGQAQGITPAQYTATAIIAGATATQRAILEGTATFTEGPSPTPPPTQKPGDAQLTATSIIAQGTLNAILFQGTQQGDIVRETADAYVATATTALGVLYPTLIVREQTAVFVRATETTFVSTRDANRTAIVVTREPSLRTIVPLVPVQLTATALYSSSLESTGPNLRTPIPTDTCYASIRAYGNPTIEQVIQETLQNAGIYTEIAVITRAVGTEQTSGSPNYTRTYCDEGKALETEIYIDLTAIRITDQEQSNAINTIIGRLTLFPDIGAENPNRTRLIIAVFKGMDRQSDVINTDYQIALDAYREGLRGVALIEAMGGYVRQPTG